MERACFPALSYNNYSSIFKGKVDVSVFLTMNAGKDIYDRAYKVAMENYFSAFMMLNGDVEIIPVYDTLQIKDYSKYEMAGFNEEHKKAVREEQFPADLKKAYEIGERK